MTISQLIAKLQTYPPNTPVLHSSGDALTDVAVSARVLTHWDVDGSGAAEELGVGTFVVRLMND